MKSDRGWNSSYNSIYNKYLFTDINLRDIKNIVPSTFALSYVIKDYMYNKSNAWKSDNSIEDTFSYKNMVNWSFSEAQVLNRTYSNDNLIMRNQLYLVISVLN